MQYLFPEINLERTNHYVESQSRDWRNGRQAQRDDGAWCKAEAQPAAQIRHREREDSREESRIALEDRGAAQDGAGQVRGKEGSLAYTQSHRAALTS
jgi:hypothetical protein